MTLRAANQKISRDIHQAAAHNTQNYNINIVPTIYKSANHNNKNHPNHYSTNNKRKLANNSLSIKQKNKRNSKKKV